MLLERFCYSPMGTFGRLAIGDQIFWTVERPWENNEPYISCVPEGAYKLEPHSSEKYPDTWALVGGSVGHWPSEGRQRNRILFHQANRSHQVSGCIGIGLTLGVSHGDWAVLSSKRGVEAWRKEMYATQTRQMLITQYRPTFTTMV